MTIRGAAGKGRKSDNHVSKNSPNTEWSLGFSRSHHSPHGVERENRLEDPYSDGLRNKAGFRLNTQTGEYEQYVTPRIDKPFCIAGGKEFHHSGESAYRKAIIALEPNIVGGGFRITVTIQHETEKTVVIEDYTYPSSLQYTENRLSFPTCCR